MNPDVFISYNWNSKPIVDELESVLIGTHFQVNRDIRDIGNWSSIKDFMDSIPDNSNIILVISSYYLKSLTCVYEGIISMKSCKSTTSLFITSDASDIYSQDMKSTYMHYWLDNNTEYFSSDLEKYIMVKKHISDFINWITDLKNPIANDIFDFSEKFIEKNIIDSLKDTNYEDLIDDLNICDYIVISDFPEYPFLEKRYTYLKHKYLVADNGLTFVFYLKDENNFVKRILISNVEKIEKGNEGCDFSKYYFKCIDTKILLRQYEAQTFEKKYSEDELDPVERVRIIIHFNLCN